MRYMQIRTLQIRAGHSPRGHSRHPFCFFTQQMRHDKRGARVRGLYGTAPRQLQNWNWQDPKAPLPADPPQGTQGGGIQLKSKCRSKKVDWGHLALCRIAQLQANVDIHVGHRPQQYKTRPIF